MTDKVLIFDCETSYNIVDGVWRCGKQYINPDQIIKERQIISIAWMWEGENRKDIKTLDWGLNKQCDKSLLTKFQKVMSKADVVIGQNSDSFDIKWVRGRLWHHGLPNVQPLVTLDTLKMSRKAFNLNSHKLDYKLKLRGGEGKLPTDMDLWRRVMKGEQAALDYMLKYNKADVWKTYQHFMDIKPYCELPKYHWSGVTGKSARGCDNCGEDTLIKHSKRTSKGVNGATVRQVYKCKTCGSCVTREKIV